MTRASPHHRAAENASGGPACAAIVLLTLAAIAPHAVAQSSPPAPAGESALPRPDILNVVGQAPPAPALADDAANRVSGTGDVTADEQTQVLRRPVTANEPALAVGSAPGAVAEDEIVLNRRNESASVWSVRDLAPLMVVVGLILAAAVIVKRYMPARRLLTGQGVLDIVARTPLSSKQTLVLVKMGRQLVLVGVSPEQMSTLSIVDDAEQVAMLLGEIASRGPSSMTRAFADSFDAEADAYRDEPIEPRARRSHMGSHLRGLVDKVRQLQRREDVA